MYWQNNYHDVALCHTYWKELRITAIIHNYDPRVNITYVYESKGYYDRETHKTKTKRKLIGKLDENGNVVPTGKRGSHSGKKKAVAQEADSIKEELVKYKDLYERYLKDSDLKEERIQALMQEVETERKTRKECEKVLRKIMEIGSNYSSAGNVT